MLVRSIAFLAALLANATFAAEPNKLAAKLDAILDGPDFKHSHWGVLVVDAKSGESLFERNAEKLFAPASVTKLFSVASALETFGPKFVFETPVYARGDVAKDGTLKGDLILVASGDPSFGGRDSKDGKLAFQNYDHTYANSGLAEAKLTDTDPLAAIKDLAKQVHAAGIRSVEGDVLIDERLFPRGRSSGSGPDVLSAICINDNVLDVTIEPGEKPGDPAKVSVRPETSTILLDVDVATKDKSSVPLTLLSQTAPGQFALRGRVPAGGKPIVAILPIEDPALFARTHFIEQLRKRGVKVAAPLVRPTSAALPEIKDYATMKPIAQYASSPISEVFNVTLKVSHNLYASMIPCLVAARGGKSTMEDGLKMQRKILKGLGVDTDQVSFGSSAGGSVADLVTPKATVQLLQGLKAKETWSEFQSWLPVYGVDGTLVDAADKDSPAKGKVFAKTGTNFWADAVNNRPLLKSKALAGVMATSSGRELLFAIFVNDVPIKADMTIAKIGKVLGKVCDVLHADSE